MKKSLICIKFANNPAIKLYGTHDLLRSWFKENGIETYEWFNLCDAVNVCGFDLSSEEDYIAAKLQWDEFLI